MGACLTPPSMTTLLEGEIYLGERMLSLARKQTKHRTCKILSKVEVSYGPHGHTIPSCLHCSRGIVVSQVSHLHPRSWLSSFIYRLHLGIVGSSSRPLFLNKLWIYSLSSVNALSFIVMLLYSSVMR